METLYVMGDAMDSGSIMEFAGLYLLKHKYLTTPSLQRFIMNRIEVGKAISPEEIEIALDKLRYAGFIEQVLKDQDGWTVYAKDKRTNANL